MNAPGDESLELARPRTLAELVAAATAEREAVEAARPRKHPEEPRSEMEPASGWLEAREFIEASPGERLETLEDQDRRRRTYTRQVGIRLSHGQFGELCHAADLYGVAPGTMARMLVRRGARAVLEARHLYDLEQGGVD